MLPVFVSVSTDIPDYLRLAEVLLGQFADVLLTAPKMQARLRAKVRNWRFERVHFGGLASERESPRLFLSSGSSLLRHMLTEAWDDFLRPAGLNGAIFFLDDLQNITSISKEDLALMIRDQFQWFGIEGMNYSVCFSAKPDYFARTKAPGRPSSAVLYEVLSRAFHAGRDAGIRTPPIRPTARHLGKGCGMASQKNHRPPVFSCLYL